MGRIGVIVASLLGLSVAGSGWLDVPFVRQEKHGCGAACLSMVARYWRAQGVSVLPDPAPEEILAHLYAPGARGIFGRDMERYLRGLGFHAFAFEGEWRDLEGNLAKGRPLIVCLGPPSQADLHYVVVAGLAAGMVLVNDPADRKLRKMARKTFEAQWKAAGRWTLLAVPKAAP